MDEQRYFYALRVKRLLPAIYGGLMRQKVLENGVFGSRSEEGTDVDTP